MGGAVVRATAATVLLIVAPAGATASAAPRTTAPTVPILSPAHPSGPASVTQIGTPTPSASDATVVDAASQGDPLTENGLASVLCRDSHWQRRLSAPVRRNCATSSFVGAAAPTGNYAFDVHIDTGLVPVNADSLVQDILLTPLWTVLVWSTHALVVALEWCYSIDLLHGTALSGVTSALRSMQSTITQPWLAVVLAVASVIALYHGLVRRRVAETLGQVLLMLTMMVGGLWVILDPVGTVGALSEWTNEASLGAVGAVTQGRPDRAELTLGDGLQAVFDTGIGGPWCFMEFGNVDWCRTPARLDPRLRVAADQIQSSEQRSTTSSGRQSAALLAGAITNGELFLSLPANGPERNSINDPRSLLHVLCQSDDATHCRGPTAAQAEFRTGSNTWSRAAGLLLICAGLLSMFLLLGFIALRLLGAAIASLFFLLIAPVAVLAPALGDGGRAAFRAWTSRLLGAVVAKLTYSVLLGVVLLLLHVLEGMGSLGWWTQWLLVACLWWTVFHHRDHLLIGAGLTSDRTRPAQGAVSSMLQIRRLIREYRSEDDGPHRRRGERRSGRRDGSGEATDRARRGHLEEDSRWDPAAYEGGETQTSAPASPVSAARQGLHGVVAHRSPTATSRLVHMGQAAALAVQTDRVLDHTPGAGAGVDLDALAGQVALGRQRMSSLHEERARAVADGDRTRGLRVEHRARHVAAETADAERLLHSLQSNGVESRVRVNIERFLDDQARLPSGRQRASAGHERRDYPGLAPLAGLSPGAYAHAQAGEQLRARLAIDRELDRRRVIISSHRPVATSAGPSSVGMVPRPLSLSGSARAGTGTGPPAEDPGAAPLHALRRLTRLAPTRDVNEDSEPLVMRRERQFLRDNPGVGLFDGVDVPWKTRGVRRQPARRRRD